MVVKLGNEWDMILKEEFEKEYYIKIRKTLVSEYKNHTVYPDMYDIFNALKYTSFSDVKAVIIGQDPYHEPNQAHGLSFSVQKGVDIPPSLQNIYRELESDLNIKAPSHGNLSAWARQGVLLLNATLTVRAHLANSHAGIGWQIFTDRIISLLNESKQPIAFLLWGANAKRKKELITNPRHYILESAHPSPLSAFRGFFGSRPFSKINTFLKENGRPPIDWHIPE
ncbi:MAG: uracil-DNA glycosylase [Ruminococcaceae bacterium]|nr:uracil-DNA glycosylase [Oscillospiraceae bacterium]